MFDMAAANSIDVFLERFRWWLVARQKPIYAILQCVQVMVPKVVSSHKQVKVGQPCARQVSCS